MIEPYHPSATDWTIRGDLNLVEIPNFCDLAMESHDPWQRDRDQWPLFRTQGAEFLLNKIDGYIQYVRERNVKPVLCLYLHPWEFHPMPQGAIDFGEADVTPKAFITKNCGEVAVRELDKVIVRLKELGGIFQTAEDLANEY